MSAAGGGPPIEPQRLLLAGDAHLNGGWLEQLVAIASEQDCQAIVQLGDLGFFPRRPVARHVLGRLEQRLAEYELDFYFLEGNHDDLDALWRTKRRMRGPFVEIGPHLFYLRRGCRFSWRGVHFLAVGGAYSIDQGWRRRAELQPRTLWWPEETLTDLDVTKACAGGEVDVLLSHDCPAGVSLPNLRPLPEAEQNRERLARIVDCVRPRLLFHGHYHQRFDGVYRNQRLGLEVRTFGLADDQGGWASLLILDLEQWPSQPTPGPQRTDES